VILNLSIVSIALSLSLLWLVGSYLQIRRALQWWSRRLSIQLLREAENIRDGLLQDSFTMRRSLELSLGDNVEVLVKKNRDWLRQFESFHDSLGQLSDRLSPAYIEDSLPLAIQALVERWQKGSVIPVKIDLELPQHWTQEPADRSLLLLGTLDELLRITLSELLTELKILICLKRHKDMGELSVHISYPNEATLVSYSGFKELQYLSQVFQFLTSGQCFRQRRGLIVVWCFRWHSPQRGRI
jgi:hypothetical protein